MNAITQNWIDIGTLDDIPQQGARCVKNGSNGGRSVPVHFPRTERS